MSRLYFSVAAVFYTLGWLLMPVGGFGLSVVLFFLAFWFWVMWDLREDAEKKRGRGSGV